MDGWMDGIEPFSLWMPKSGSTEVGRVRREIQQGRRTNNEREREGEREREKRIGQ
jgi:hypothetical protein